MPHEPEAPPPSPGRRRPRRADAGPARPGAETTPPTTPPAATAPADADAALLPPRAAEDTGQAWGDWRDDGDSNDERLLRDRPPHWG